MADKLEAARKRKQRISIIAAAAGALLVAGGVVWAVTSLGGGDNQPAPEAEPPANNCIWSPDDVAQNPDLKDVGAPPTGLAPDKGTQLMTITTNLGVIEAEINTAKAPCTARSM